jgi:alpha-beta hydrolase superfamily lysophospholipase
VTAETTETAETAGSTGSTPPPQDATSRLSLADVLSHPMGLSVHDLSFGPDLLGPGYGAHTLVLGDDPDEETPGGPVVTTLVRHLPTGVADDAWRTRPALLFVHGMTDFFFQTHVAEHFHALGYAVYGLDLRKCGRSHRPGQTWHHVSSQSIYDEDLTVALSLLAAGHPSVIPVGHSTGGLDVTMWVARLHRAAADGDAARARLYAAVRAVVLNSPWLDLQFDALTNAVIRHIFPTVARFAPDWHVPGGIDPSYGRTLHVGEYGEWDYDRTYKPLYPRPKKVSWLVGVSREIDKLHTGGFATGVPTLLLCSDRHSGGGHRNADGAAGGDGAAGADGTDGTHGTDSAAVPDPDAFVTDTVLKPDQMRAAAHLVDPHCDVRTVPGAMHDVFLSGPEVRAAAFRAADAWLAALP